MVVEEYALIQVSKPNKEKLDNYKLFNRESYNSVLNELIKFGEENNFKNIRIKNLTKNLEENENGTNKVKQRAISTISGK